MEDGSRLGLPEGGDGVGDFILPILILPVSTGRWKYPP